MMRVVGRSFSGSYFAAFLQWAKNGGNDAMNLEEEENGMDEEKRNWMEARYDGYQMLWAFDNTELVEDADGAVDAGCISSKYGGGGFCAGIEYTGTNTKTPRAWA